MLAFTIDATNPLVINSAGISVAAMLSLSGTWSMDLFNIVTVRVTNPTLTFNNTDPTNPLDRVPGGTEFPDLNNA